MKQLLDEYYIALQDNLPKIFLGLLILLLFVILGKVFHFIIGKKLARRWTGTIKSNFILEAVKWIFYIIGFLAALNIVGLGSIASSLIAGAGISAIIFGFAFKDIGENFLAGIILAIKRPFDIEDIIEINGNKGTVKDLDLRVTHLRNVEGKDIYIPNSMIIKNSLVNYTKDGNLRISFMIGIAPESDIELTRRIIIDYLKLNERILDFPAPNVLVQELGEFTVDLSVLFWVDILSKPKAADDSLGHTIRSKVISDVKKLLDENGIEMPSQVLEHKMYRDNKLVMEEKR